jgi:mono/diheme cytochrome c family protein
MRDHSVARCRPGRRAALLRALLLTLVAAFAAACGSARRSEPLAGAAELQPAAARGEVVFARQCQMCHPRGEAALGPALNNKPLPGFAIAFQVRHGLGAMPAFDEREISDAELADLVAYVKALRSAPRI